VRDTTVFNHLLALPGVWVTAVKFGTGAVTVDVRLRRRRLVWPHCGWSTKARHNVQPEPSTWRALDLGVWKVWVRARLRRLTCPDDGVVVEQVPFARHGARLTRDVDDFIAWLATKTDKTAVCRLLRVNWRTVGKVVQRPVADELDPGRLDDLYRIGVDEVSYRKHRHYLRFASDCVQAIRCRFTPHVAGRPSRAGRGGSCPSQARSTSPRSRARRVAAGAD
jgi:hypothetical protein